MCPARAFDTSRAEVTFQDDVMPKGAKPYESLAALRRAGAKSGNTYTSSCRDLVLGILRGVEYGLTAKQIARNVKRPYNSVRAMMSNMARRGDVLKLEPEPGKNARYRLV